MASATGAEASSGGKDSLAYRMRGRNLGQECFSDEATSEASYPKTRGNLLAVLCPLRQVPLGVTLLG